MFEKTIAAVSTPRGTGGIAVIRISGEDALLISEKFIKAKSGKNLSDIEPRKVFSADIYGDGELLDTALVTIFRTPHSFTGEDTVEISCHGGALLTAQILASAIAHGAVQAGPGEFTRRAFSSGKLTLSEAEGISELISAKSTAALRISNQNAHGALAKEINEIYSDIKTVLSAVYAGIDFPDEDLADIGAEQMTRETENIREKLAALKNSYKTGHAIVEGIKTVICGKPNTGKSTLLNLLCKSDRAIVTDIAGTTRDTITETVVCGNAALILSDTAGIHDTDDMIEGIGVGRSIKAIDDAELILAVFDISRPLDADDEKIVEKIKSCRASGAYAVALTNKTDLCKNPYKFKYEDDFDKTMAISACDKKYYDVISDMISNIFSCGEIGDAESATVTTARQYAKICAALESMTSALDALSAGHIDAAGMELEGAMSVLGELDGRSVGIDIVDDIFSKFCVGK